MLGGYLQLLQLSLLVLWNIRIILRFLPSTVFGHLPQLVFEIPHLVLVAFPSVILPLPLVEALLSTVQRKLLVCTIRF